MAKSKFVVCGVELTKEAYENLEEVGMLDGADMARDVQNLKTGDVAPYRLLAQCLDGADDDRAEGWRDYVAACCREAGVEPPRGAEASGTRGPAIYRAKFSRPEGLDEATANTLRLTEESDEPLELIEVTDACATFGVSARLFDADGRDRGTVDKAGAYELR